MTRLPSTTTSLVRFAWLSVAAALLTFFLKLLAWKVTGSVSLLSDALESLANLAAALVTMASLIVAARPADDEHAYGHTKAEYFASGIEGALILVAAAGIGWSAVDRFFAPRALGQPYLGIALSAVASIVNLTVARLLFSVARRHHSVALEADAKHLMTDVWTSGVAILAVALVSLTGWSWLDPALGLLLAAHIVTTGIKLVHHSMLGLMDTGLPPGELAAVRAVLDSFAPRGVQHHALRTRVAGARRFMSVHLLFPGEWSVARAHALSEEIEAALRQAVPRLTILTHLEPIEDPTSWSDVGLDRSASS